MASAGVGAGRSCDPDEPRFRPDAAGKPVEATTQATFTTPGAYWIRAIASDGLLEANHDIKVTVTSQR